MGLSLLLAGIVALVAGVIGEIDYTKDYEQRQSDIKEDQSDLEEQYNQSVKNSTDEFAAKKENAEEDARKLNVKADRLDQDAAFADQALNIQERLLDTEYNQGLGQIQAEQADRLWSWNNALASIGANTGNELASIANSGIRAGSSLSKAVEMEAATNNMQLERQINNAERNDKWNLQNLFANQKQGEFSIWKGRVDADNTRFDATDLRNDAYNITKSYEEGGTNWNLWQDSLNSLGLDYQQKNDKLQREYDNNEKNLLWGQWSSFLTMGTKGFKTGYDFGNMLGNAGK